MKSFEQMFDDSQDLDLFIILFKNYFDRFADLVEDRWWDSIFCLKTEEVQTKNTKKIGFLNKRMMNLIYVFNKMITRFYENEISFFTDLNSTRGYIEQIRDRYKEFGRNMASAQNDLGEVITELEKAISNYNEVCDYGNEI
jgi:hypothetical protein